MRLPKNPLLLAILLTALTIAIASVSYSIFVPLISSALLGFSYGHFNRSSLSQRNLMAVAGLFAVMIAACLAVLWKNGMLENTVAAVRNLSPDAGTLPFVLGVIALAAPFLMAYIGLGIGSRAGTPRAR